MKELSLSIADKLSLSYKWQRNIYFTLAIVLVTAGVDTLKGSWILVAIGILSEEVLNKSIDNYDIVIGVMLLIGGFVIAWCGLRTAKMQRHDEAKYEELRRQVNFDAIRDILNHISTYLFYHSSQDSTLYQLQDFLSKPENQFLARAVRSKAASLHSRMSAYLSFRATNFFVYPSDQISGDFTYYIQPGLDIGKDLQVFDQAKADRLDRLHDALVQETEAVKTSLTSFILTAKNHLGV